MPGRVRRSGDPQRERLLLLVVPPPQSGRDESRNCIGVGCEVKRDGDGGNEEALHEVIRAIVARWPTEVLDRGRTMVVD